MKPLSPIVIAGVGPLLLGIAVTLAALLTAPDMRDARGVSLWFGMGVGMGLIMLGPIAVAVKFRSGLVRRLGPNLFRIQWCVSLIMAGAMGYIVASSLHKTFDAITGLAMLLVFLGAMTKTNLGIIFKREEYNRWWV
jgi:hypothetical protein